MKRLFVIFCLSLVCFTCFCGDITCGVAAADADPYKYALKDELQAAALQNPKVKKAEAFVSGDVAVIALRCEAIYFHSENVKLRADIERRVSVMDIGKVYVTTDTDIFLKIAAANAAYAESKSGAEYIKAKENILKTVTERENKR
ncbi:MAG: YhcN/YlaJ family sporulation lipoprotein [Clostridiales bacterium]|jgi:hypothetical protein|nr:YhcN/YlaJ family sporulation lipoprotein [Clostridiales bacterium]